MFNDPQITAAAIIGGCAVAASVIASISGALIGKRFQDQKKLKEDLREAISDIEFLLAVEEEHGKIHKQNSGSSQLRTVRSKVEGSGLSWSQRFTPGRAKNLRSIF